jgi:microcystin-dependent protein
MATQPFLGEVRLFAFGYPPKGWAQCNGQLLAIAQNQALFSILGTTYGGNGVNTFALPNFQGRVSAHWGNGMVLGETAGSPTVTLLSNQSGHSHSVASNATASAYAAGGNFPASAPAGQNLYGPTANTTMNPSIVQTIGGSQPHNNMQPYTVLIYCIALQGIFPSRN